MAKRKHTSIRDYDKVVTVSPDGNADYTSVRTAASDADNGATILIYPGTYTNPLDNIEKDLTLVAVDKNSVVLDMGSAFAFGVFAGAEVMFKDIKFIASSLHQIMTSFQSSVIFDNCDFSDGNTSILIQSSISVKFYNCVGGYIGGDGNFEIYNSYIDRLTNITGTVNIYGSIVDELFRDGAGTIKMYNCNVLQPNFSGSTTVLELYNCTLPSEPSSMTNIIVSGFSTIGKPIVNIDMNSKKLTSLAVGTTNGDSIRQTTKITEVILEANKDHVDDTSTNPHSVTAAQAGAAPAAEGVTNGNTHDHIGGDGAQIVHSGLNLDDGTNPHSTTKSDVGLGTVTDNAQVKKISNNTDNNIPQWDGIAGDLLKDGLGLVTIVGTPGSDSNIPTEQAVREGLDAVGGGGTAYSRIVYVDKAGNDSDSGTNLEPKLTLGAAYTVAVGLTPIATAPILIKMGVGTFSDIELAMNTNYIDIQGSGRDKTILYNDNFGGNNGNIINQTGIGNISDLTMHYADATYYGFSLDQGSSLTKDNSRINNVRFKITGVNGSCAENVYGRITHCFLENDGRNRVIQSLLASGRIAGCRLETSSDRTIGSAAGEILNCHLLADHNVIDSVTASAIVKGSRLESTASGGSGREIIGNLVNGAEFYGTSFIFSGSSGGSSSNFLRIAGGLFVDCYFDSHLITSNSSVLVLGGSPKFFGCHFYYDTGEECFYASSSQTVIIGQCSFEPDDSNIAHANITLALRDYSQTIGYDNTTSGLSATNVKDAIDETTSKKQITLKLVADGALTVADDKDRIVCPFTGNIDTVIAIVGTAATGTTNIIIDIEKESDSKAGTNPPFTTPISIFNVNLLNVDLTKYNSEAATTAYTLHATNKAVAKGDMLRINVDQIGNTIAGSDLEVIIYITE